MRLGQGGLVDRDRHLGFRFDGHAYEGLEGDTLASALLANGIRLVGRSFKYHRPRGILTAGSEEPNALVTLGRGAAQEPNARATTVELRQGLEARPQNAWPSLGVDALAVNDLLSPFLSAGFYYKTFMGPHRIWERVFEPAIRRAAGLGRLSQEVADLQFEKAFAFCDLLVIGAGPAGLMAALTAGEAGADVILADEDFLPGGRLNAEREEVGGRSGAGWAAEAVTRLEAMPNVRIMSRTAVTGVYDQGTYGALQKHPAAAGRPEETFWRIVARRAVLAAGAIERPVALANNDRPGVMLAGAVRSYLNRYAVAPGRRAVVFGASDEARRTAADLRRAGVHVAALVDARERAETSDFATYAGATVERVLGREVEGVAIRLGNGREERVQADLLAMSGGWNPNVHLSCHLNGRPVWDESLSAFLPAPGAVPGLIPAGSCNGAVTTAACLAAGREAAARALEDLGLKATAPDLPEAEDRDPQARPIWVVPGKGRKWVDFQNDVTTKDIELAARENFRSVEHMKRYTTQGMATDQGKTGGVTALSILADATGRSIPETGTTTYRPPYAPIQIAALGAGGEGRGFAAERFTAAHPVHLAMGAPMVEAGLWFRPSYYPRTGEKTWRQACDREALMVRETVGVCDVSTLGKIDVQGPDAAAFLDFVYSNTMSTLKQGKVRYGLMLREDGHIMDDGTCARIGPDHYLVSTTTAAAGEVMRHMEFAAQVLRPELDVHLVSVTEQWAQTAIAGPESRDLLNEVLDSPLDPGTWPFMACGAVTVGGVPARLFRISFSGEHAYEIAVPARYGESLFRQLVARAEARGGGAYGMEALNVLRIEKGLLTHAELDGRTTAFDLNLSGMMSKKKDFVGRAAAGRAGLLADDRPRLVGIRPVGAVRQLTAGAFLFDPETESTRENAQGTVSSVAFSPTLGHFIGLALLKEGPERHGETVRMVDHLRRVSTLCEVCDPAFFDPAGGRARD
ncbi:sarcosine oxidase, alpha subunit family protein [Pseudooceanicola batsensis HTCC2597]|uniref:Sarcosine oxidase, alpha subunit family protein n=1 Tax=Pseudooceanicola batsensis (strain ATCC BAA-863 / DSM 15984 / KCTC 12145 / HTCC2597) TaxID=252305 RepID=A3U214_PSEBH|nr:sarcosine oxidase subunit alpha family protein [Pseudooceanicola batsensis]EAQ01948.1 sarcosine oxidase, alpha subunit family protein [Pseudooceanicola batsensis HTCC2597]